MCIYIYIHVYIYIYTYHLASTAEHPRSEGFSRRPQTSIPEWFGARTTPQPPQWAVTFLATMDWARSLRLGFGRLSLAVYSE